MQLTDVTFEKLSLPPRSTFFRSLKFRINGFEKTWNLIENANNLGVVVFNITTNTVVFLKQFAAGTYANHIPKEKRIGNINTVDYPAELGVTVRLCLAVAESDKNPVEVIQKQILEECGYDVPLDSIEEVARYPAGVGYLSFKQTLFYCEVTNDMKVATTNLPNMVEPYEMTESELKSHLSKEYIQSPMSALLAMHWFLYNKGFKSKL